MKHGFDMDKRGQIKEFLIVFLLIALLAVSLVLVFIVISPSPPKGTGLISLDWAGYVVTSDSANPQPLVTGVSGSWVVPEVSISQGDTYASAWIGIGGQLDDTLIQTGTDQDSIGGAVTYFAWYELLPDDAVTITTVNVSAGDEIAASIAILDAATSEWSIELDNLSNGQGFNTTVVYDSSQLSAEWILERPEVGNAISSLADFGSITFTNSTVTIGSSSGTVKNFSFSEVTMHNRQNIPLATVSSLSSDGKSFTISYSA